MKNNLTFVRTESGGTAPAVLINKNIWPKVEHLVALDVNAFYEQPRRCVIPRYNDNQSEPIVRRRVNFSYNSLPRLLLSLLTGWYFIKPYVFPIYYANSEGLRLIAEYGSPRKASASL